MTNKLILALSLLALGGCTLAPRQKAVPLPVATNWSVETPPDKAANLGWRDVFTDLRLKASIELALKSNRDLRVAILNIDKARAQHRAALSPLLPALSLNASSTQSETPGSVTSTGTTTEPVSDPSRARSPLARLRDAASPG